MDGVHQPGAHPCGAGHTVEPRLAVGRMEAPVSTDHSGAHTHRVTDVTRAQLPGARGRGITLGAGVTSLIAGGLRPPLVGRLFPEGNKWSNYTNIR